MLSTAIIVFREIFEISLVLSILLAATKQLTDRMKWINIGIWAGVFGSCLVALFTNIISQSLDGMGQEVFNALVLGLAALMIGWTVVWMSHHGRTLAKEMKDIGQAVSLKQKPLYTVAIVVALTVLRDGSEIVLFTYGVTAAGASKLSIILGTILGLLSGLIVGAGIYFGIMNISTKKVFNITSWILIFLSAGMISQSAGYLTASGYLPEIVSQVWDTSKLIPDNTILGQILHTLLGYTSRPSGIQLLSYILTIGGILMFLKYFENLHNKPLITKSLLVFLGIVSTLIAKLPNSYAFEKVYSPIVHKGEWEIETIGEYTIDKDPSKDGSVTIKNAIGYGVTDRWATEIYGELEKEAEDHEDRALIPTAIEWENRFQLFEQGQLWFDAGLYFAYETSLEADHADKIEWKTLLEKSFDKITHTANISFEKQVGGDSTKQIGGGFAWSSKYRLFKQFEPGIEYRADFGEFRSELNYNDQEHQLGPVFYGKVFEHIKYDVGYLFGISDSAPMGDIRWILEAEWAF